MARESMEFDVVIVGAGPAGLAAAIRLRQLADQTGQDISVCVLEKGSEVGAHILSGAVLDPKALDELLPDWQSSGAPVSTAVQQERFLFLRKQGFFSLPVPPQMHSAGTYVISLGNLCRWLAEQAEALGVEIFPGFAASEVLYGDQGEVVGVATGDMGIAQDSSPKPNYQQGIELRARHTLFAEGCRGSLTRELLERHKLQDECDPQIYGLGIKELWDIDPALNQPGQVIHSVGWPLDRKTYGGGFLYHLEGHQVAVGFVVGLDYQNPYMSPFEEFQRFKTHPAIRGVFTGARPVAYGARALSEGGYQAIPRLSFPGGLLIGDTAGFLNVPRIKGIHCAMKSGMLAAEAIATDGAEHYATKLHASWLGEELYRARNIRPAFRWGLYGGLAYAAIDTYFLRGRAPWTLHHQADHTHIKKAEQCQPITYPKPDGVLTFDRSTSLSLANIGHDEDQPVHLQLDDPERALKVNLSDYAGPEARYCPAGVYEFVEDGETGAQRLQINAQNCLHCKSCDIKDPGQNIRWIPPEGGSGPSYPNM